MTAKVKCDSCKAWEQTTPTFEDTLAWHGKPCPACGVAPIVSDADAEVLRGLIALRDAGVIRMWNESDAGGLKVSVDTAGLRE